MLATSNMLADIAKGGHSLKKAAPIVKKGRPEDEPARTRLRKWGWGGGLKHGEVGEEGAGGGTARTSSPTRSSLRKQEKRGLDLCRGL